MLSHIPMILHIKNGLIMQPRPTPHGAGFPPRGSLETFDIHRSRRAVRLAAPPVSPLAHCAALRREANCGERRVLQSKTQVEPPINLLCLHMAQPLGRAERVIFLYWRSEEKGPERRILQSKIRVEGQRVEPQHITNVLRLHIKMFR